MIFGSLCHNVLIFLLLNVRDRVKKGKCDETLHTFSPSDLYRFVFIETCTCQPYCQTDRFLGNGLWTGALFSFIDHVWLTIITLSFIFIHYWIIKTGCGQMSKLGTLGMTTIHIYKMFCFFTWTSCVILWFVWLLLPSFELKITWFEYLG